MKILFIEFFALKFLFYYMFPGSLNTTQTNLHSLFSTKPRVVRVPKSKPFSFRSIKNIFNWEVTEDYEPPPMDTNKKVLILDMDETLIHSSNFPPHPKVSYFVLSDKNMPESSFFVYKRPGLDNFLKFVQENFEVFIFTYGQKEYADPIIDKIFPSLDKDHRLYRDLCETSSGLVKKNLEMFKTSEKNIILVDDNEAEINFNPSNTIKIKRWKGIPDDTELIDWLPKVLRKCKDSEDVREIIAHEKKKSH